VDQPKKTAIYKIHVENFGRTINFSGWQMPLQFEEGVLAEHLWTRQSASLFDVGHMTILDISSDQTEQLETATPASIEPLRLNRMKYGTFTNSTGGIVDDFMITRISETTLRIVANSSRKEQVINHLNAAEVSTNHRTDLSMFAVQGPKASEVIKQYEPDIDNLKFLQTSSITVNDVEVEISRSGYTGEDGFELTMNSAVAEKVANEILEHSAVKLAGLGARDSLRLEAGMCLYGNDLDETTSPVEADLKWSIAKSKLENPNFLGSSRILKEIEEGPSRIRVGIASLNKKPIRPPADLKNSEGENIGIVTSGGFGPSVNKPVAMGYVKAEQSAVGTELVADVRGKEVECVVTELPFIANNYHR